jgi:PleD family two-component response regulator
MPLTEILIIGTNKPIMETIERLINKGGIWKATIAFSEYEALSLAQTKDFKVILLCAGIADELKLKEQLLALKPKLPLVKHFGGGSGLLFAEIYEALKFI